VDRLPIVPTGLSPFTWHVEFPAYHPVLEVARRHCEFMVNFRLDWGFGLCDPAVIERQSEQVQEGTRKTRTTVLKTPRGELTEVCIHDREVGSWGTAKAFVENEEDLARFESLPFEPYRPDVSGIERLRQTVGEAGLVYCNGIRDALGTATRAMSEQFRPIFCFTEPERLRRMVDRTQQRLYEHVEYLLDQGCGPVFRLYAIEPFVEPVMPPSFVDEFIVPYDREIVKLIHDRGRHVVMHCHGRLRAQIPRMVQIGIDGVDCVESPPANDATLAEMMRMAEGRFFLWGYVQFEDLARLSGEQIEQQVRAAVEVGGTEGRYILGQAASPWSAEISARTEENWIRMIEAGARYGGH
jgi:hypothetical protein